MKSSTFTRESISALVDGQLDGEQFADALAACHGDASCVAEWDAYHLIGDVLRSPVLAAYSVDASFMARLNGRLALESLGSATVEQPLLSVAPVEPVKVAANDANFRWKLAAGFASLAAVVAVGWSSAGLLSPAAGPQIAQANPEQILVSSPQGTMVRDARLEEMLAAHKQFGGTSALQVPSGFLRNATFETPRSAGR